MAPKPRQSEEFELLRRQSSESHDTPSSPDLDALEDPLDGNYALNRQSIRRGLPRLARLFSLLPFSRRRASRRFTPWRRLFSLLLIALFSLLIITAIFFPSYSNPPPHYGALRRRCLESGSPGRGNINNEKVYIAASLYDPDGGLADGAWGTAVVELINLLGPDNVHLSIAENDVSDAAQGALDALGERVSCNTSFPTAPLPLSSIHHFTGPTGPSAPSRIAFLASVRNRALASISTSPTPFDKLLFLNDVQFQPLDALHLLFSTHASSGTGQPEYAAACAMDFINPFKFYDRFALRDVEGWESGIPFFPWFTGAGAGGSRADVLAQRDAVRVRSCWGGMVAFEAREFQSRDIVGETSGVQDPLKFRASGEAFWEASECCLVHADLAEVRRAGSGADDVGIYVNPYVRVAYSAGTLHWLAFTRRFERLYSGVHALLNRLVGLPWDNPRRGQKVGEEYVERVWNEKGGNWEDVKRAATPGGFCGIRKMQVLRESREEGKGWTNVPVPGGL